MDGWASNNLVNRGHQAFKQDLDQALRWYAHALEFNAESSDAYYWRAVANQRRNRLDLSRSDLDRAIEFNPRHFDAYLLMDHLLLTQRDFDMIVAYWNRFLELEPEHARAYWRGLGPTITREKWQSPRPT